jgi:hypothetical protein
VIPVQNYQSVWENLLDYRTVVLMLVHCNPLQRYGTTEGAEPPLYLRHFIGGFTLTQVDWPPLLEIDENAAGPRDLPDE